MAMVVTSYGFLLSRCVPDKPHSVAPAKHLCCSSHHILAGLQHRRVTTPDGHYTDFDKEPWRVRRMSGKKNSTSAAQTDPGDTGQNAPLPSGGAQLIRITKFPGILQVGHFFARLTCIS